MSGDRIVSAGVPGMATANPLCGKPRPSGQTMLLQCFLRVFGARREVPAILPKHRTHDIAISLQQTDKNPRHRALLTFLVVRANDATAQGATQAWTVGRLHAPADPVRSNQLDSNETIPSATALPDFDQSPDARTAWARSLQTALI